ncbi:MAG: ABC transporter ATP-binding protein [Bdellovibrionia bacterium]
MQKPILKLENVTVTLGGEEILSNISLEIMDGETAVFVGPSGGGKTVLLKTMAGVYAPSSGHVYFDGEDWQNLQSDQKRQLARKIGMQFQKSALFDSLSAGENVAFPLREHTEMGENEIQNRVQECLAAVGLEKAIDQLPHELSGGMRQRLGIARSIALNPQIVFYDDPTAGLDPINTDRMLDLIQNLKTNFKSTVILVTHDMSCAYQMAGRIFLVANREVIETGDAEQTQAHKDPRVQQFIHGHLNGPLRWG